MCAHLNGASRGDASIVLEEGEARAPRLLARGGCCRCRFGVAQVPRDREVERFRGGALLVHGGPREDAAEEAGKGSRRTEGTTYGSDSGRSRAISAGL